MDMSFEAVGVDPLEMEPMAVMVNSTNNNHIHSSNTKSKEETGTKTLAAKCPHCSKEFTNLRHHINQQHMQVKNFNCAECGYSCYLRTDLERHINNVHEKFRSPCPVCGKKYSDLRQHVRIVHEGAKAECPQCKGKYSNLSQHVNKVHKKTKNVMCEKCGMTFYHNSNLKKHTETSHAQTKSVAPVYPAPLEPPSEHFYNFRHTFNPPYDAYSYAQYNHYHQHNHYYQNNSYYGRQWW